MGADESAHGTGSTWNGMMAANEAAESFNGLRRNPRARSSCKKPEIRETHLANIRLFYVEKLPLVS